MSKWQGDISPPRYPALQWEALEVGEYIVCGPQQRSRVQDARDRWPDLRTEQREMLGKVEAYTIADFTAGLARGGYTPKVWFTFFVLGGGGWLREVHRDHGDGHP